MGLTGNIIVADKTISIGEESLYLELSAYQTVNKAENVVMVININDNDYFEQLYLAGKLEISKGKTTVNDVDIFEYFKKYEGKNCSIILVNPDI